MKLLISTEDYFKGYSGHPGVTAAHRANAERLLSRVDTLLRRCVTFCNATLDVNPKTGTLVSGSFNGGWRPKDCPEGAERSSHKEARGVDVYDPDGDIDNAIMANKNWLTELGLAIEHPAATRGWAHITDRVPPSGNRVFYP